MIGLIVHDTLSLSTIQWIGIHVGAIIALWIGTRSRISIWIEGLWFSLFLWFLLLLFLGHKEGIDVHLTQTALGRLRGCTWRAYLSEISFLPYIKVQPPWFLWILLHLPASYVLQQGISLGIGAGILAVFWRGGGSQRAWLLAATPLFQILTTQPINDWWACGLLVFGVACLRSHHPGWGSLCLSAACLLKYTSYVAFVFLLPTFRGWILLPLLTIFGHWLWAVHVRMFWLTEQISYLLKFFSGYTLQQGAHGIVVRSPIQTIPDMIRFFWAKTLLPSVWYLCPAWSQIRSVRPVLIWGMSLIGIKYLPLVFPLFLANFPVQQEASEIFLDTYL